MDIILDMGNVLLEWNKDKILQGVSDTKEEYLILDKAIFQSGALGKIRSWDHDERRVGA